MNEEALPLSFLKVEEISIEPSSRGVARYLYEVPDKYEPVQITTASLKRPRIALGKQGKTTGLHKAAYICVLLLKNEIDAMDHKAVPPEILGRRIRKEFPSWGSTYQAKHFSKQFGVIRNQYNSGSLYADQPRPVLYAFIYNDYGYIRHNSRRKELLSFNFCKSYVLGQRFIDPRFYTEKEIAKYRKRQNDNPSNYGDLWIPTEIEIEAIEKKLNRPLFNSIVFPDGYTINSRII